MTISQLYEKREEAIAKRDACAVREERGEKTAYEYWQRRVEELYEDIQNRLELEQ